MTKRRISIIDSHKIPRKYRKGFNYYVFYDWVGYQPYCDGAGWHSKNRYLIVFPLLKGKQLKDIRCPKYGEVEFENNFNVNKKLCIELTKAP